MSLDLYSEEFFLDFHKKLFELILYLSENGKPIDLITLSAESKDRGWHDSMGGSSALISIFEDSFSLANIGAYVEIVKKKALLRRVIQLGTEITDSALSSVTDSDEFLDDVERKVFSISKKKDSKASSTLRDIFSKNLELIEEMALRKTDVTGLPTGFKDFDRLTQGLSPGQLMILAARPAMGKTSFFLSICRNIITSDPQKVIAVFSLEMTKEELGFRVLTASTRIPAGRLKIGNLADAEWTQLMSATSELANSKLEIDDSSELTVLDIKARCRRILAREKRIDLVVIDYLQLMRGHKSSQKGEGTREREVSEISRGLKSLAKELRVPIIALSQLNRALENRTNKRPLLSDLRESGSIEADADIVAFIHREEVYNAETGDKGVAEIIIAKHRAGPTGNIHLKWFSEYTVFTDQEQTRPCAATS
jgi:replicative DNA helicase